MSRLLSDGDLLGKFQIRMEILQKFKQNGYFTADLYNLLVAKKMAYVSEPIIPSVYLKEMKMTTQQRLQSLNSICVDNFTADRKPKNIVLSFTPRLLIFQNYKANDRIVAKFSVKNISKGPTFLNMVYKDSSYFSIKPVGGQLLSRLAPGISVTFAITFTPVQYEDYTHKVIFNTDVDQYVIPLIAMGPRPIFNFPDSIKIPKVPLQVENFCTMSVHNVGKVPAGFTLSTGCPFSLQPQSAYLSPNEKIDIRVGFKTMALGDSFGFLYAVCETGENFQIKAFGSTYTVSVELEKQVVRFLDTYNTMVRQQTYKIVNKSDHLLTYVCLKNDCVYYDFQEKLRLATMFYNVKESEADKNNKLVQYNIISSDEHERIYARIFFNEVQSLVVDETLQFQNMHFSISPMKGNLWPNKTTEITITFAPKEIGEFSAIAHLDIDGVQNRLPLKMVGTSLPPCIQLNLETLDMDCVYINKTYNYEIVAMNKGHINGVILYKEVPTLFSSRITCSPEMHCLRPGDKEIFVVSFCNSNQGPFFEEINFAIRDTKVVLKLYLKGEVIYPSLMFSIPCLDFGMVSLGVPKTQELEVINESTVDVTGSVKISSDGPEISSITLTDYAVAEKPKPCVPQWPREFNIEPNKIYIGPESRISIQVTLTANLIRANQTSLELELEKSDSAPIVLPVMYQAMVPELTPAPDIKLRACFVDFTYQNEIQIVANNFYGYFTLEDPEENTLQVEIKDVKEGMIEPNTTITLPVSIKTSVIGTQEHSVKLNLFGRSKPIEICHITGCGVRPIVTCTPVALHWGQVKLLNHSHKILTICNDSPVVVNFKASLLNKDGRWAIQPAESHIEPESETDLNLSLYLIDAASYSNKAVIQLEKVKDILVPLTATGVGTSICVSELRDRIVLGRHFTKIPLHCKVIMENHGSRLHSLEWVEHYKQPKTKQQASNFFNIEPRVFKLGASEKMELNVTGLSSKVTTVKEMWYLVGSVEGINKKELLLECPVICEFVDPKIEISSSIVELQYDFGPYSEFYKLTDIITIKNVSKLPLDIDLSVKHPFVVIQKQSTYKILPEDESLCCCICYNECDVNVKNIVKEVGLQQSKIFIDYLTLEPVEPLRKGHLNFFQDIHKMKMAFRTTHAIEETLEDQEVMKLQILFDTTKHLTLKSKTYCDLMRIKFKGHKNRDAIKLIGTINFPNMFVLTPRVDFQCILNGSIQSKIIKVQNNTPLLVCYKFQWKKSIIIPLEVHEPPAVEMSNTSNPYLFTIEESENEGPIGEKVTENSDGGALKEIPSLTPDAFVDTISLDDSELEFEFVRARVLKKITPMIEPEYEPIFPWTNKLSTVTAYTRININEVIEIVPHRGLLKPHEMLNIHVIFKPQRNINVKGILECEILGGPSEIITVTGQSADLMYKINSNKVNFKIRSFHDNASEQLLISNISILPFEYKTYWNEPKFENELDGTILDLVPSAKMLEPEENAKLTIVVRPGVVGYFHRDFLLEIGHLPHIPIEVFGWGVVPQVYLNLPRPEITKWDPIMGYLAIPTLTLEYLTAVNDIFSKVVSEHVNSPIVEKCFEDPDFNYGWHICSPADGFPTLIDIELAIERMLVINHIKLKPEILTLYSVGSATRPIPGFSTTPYILDYGVVITGSTVHRTVEIINYGPITTKLHFAKNTNCPPWLYMKLCGKLNPGETGKLDMVFSPTSDYFTELEQDVEISFNLEVPYGVVIPIQIKSLCAVPYLKSNVSEINFGTVRCGDKVISSIPLKNVGKPTCIWYVTLKLKVPGPNPMTILENSGKYEPGEGGWLSVAFKPTMEMTYDGLLIFRFHMNPTKMTIPITGHGIVPHVHIIGPNVNFPPTLPWAERTDIYFGITNPCPFPIELIVPHSDDLWKEEEDYYQLLHKYYNKPEEMLVPAIKPGDGWPEEIKKFHKMFKDRLKKTIDAEAAAAKAQNARASVAAKKFSGKSPKVSAKSTTNKDDKISPRRFRTETEIIADEIKNLKESDVDPLRDCLRVPELVATTPDIDKRLKGLIIFVHGSPCEEMQCQEMAYTLGKALGIPTINLDLCIVQALCECDCPAKLIIVNALNDSFETSRKVPRPDSSDDFNNYDDYFNDSDDDYSIIWKKIVFLASNKNLATPRSKMSDKKKKRSPNSSDASHSAVGAMGSTTMFQMDLIQELLKDLFNRPYFQRGFIIDSMTSIMLKNPSLVMTTVLKSMPSIWNIHLILCQSDFYKWAQMYEETQRENDLIDINMSKVYDESEIENIVKSFEDMDDEEYENANEELKKIYITHGLEERRRIFYEKNSTQSEIIKKPNEKYKSSQVTVDGVEAKKKIKKDDSKGKPTNEYVAMNAKYNEYTKNVYDNILNIANNWIFDEGDIGYPLYGLNDQILGATQKKNKKKSDVQIQEPETVLTDRGFPITLISCPCLHYKQALINMFLQWPLIKQALKVEKEEDILKTPVKNKEFTVLLPKVFPTIQHEDPLKWLFLDEKPIKKCECNQLTDLNLVDDATQENVLNILAKWNCTCGKKVASSKTSTSDIPTHTSGSMERIYEESESGVFSPRPMQKVKSISAISGRLILQTGDLVRCKYSFSPELEGHFTLKRFVEVSGWPDSRLDVNVSGICDLPRLDSRPKKMFENFVRRTVEDNVYKITYLDDLKFFEFGPIFVGYSRIYEEDYTIDLKNSSLITADVVIEFLEDTTVFQIDKNFIQLEPGCRGKLTISAAPAEVGIHKSILLFCVKDNPEIVTVTIGCSGVVPIVEILPQTKIIEYGRLLLYRREDDRFIVKNDSILPIMWKIQNAQEFVEDFIISKKSGVVLRHDNQVVPVTYIACNVGVITNKILVIEIYDEKGRGDPMIIDNLSLSAECYDVMIDCAYENPAENFLNYGNVKVNSCVVREMYLLNRGKYNIYFKLKKVKNFPEPSLLRSFEVFPECGVIPPVQKLLCIEFECTPTTSMNLVNVPAYICSLLDGSKDQVVVAKFPVYVTISAFYNTFTLFPLGELNFHIIAIGSGIIRDVILNNTSKCPFTYEIELPKEHRIDDEAQPASKVNNKIKNPPLRCGNFMIMNEDNLLPPGTSRTIEIQFLATAARKFEETINFIISDTCPAEAVGVPLKLIGTGAMPTLDFWNIETTFREHLIVKSMSEYKVPESSPHCVFEENSATLHFFRVNVNSSHMGGVDLYNNGLVASALTMKLHHQSNSSLDIFSLDKYETHIEPLLHKTLGIIFSPKSLTEYRAVLEIRLKLLDNQEQSFKICLIGEGVIPRIKLISPQLRHQRIALLGFPVTCLGSISSKEIRFKNISSVKSMVALEVIHTTTEQRPVFWLTVHENSKHMLMVGDQALENQHIKLITSPNDIPAIIVHYNPISRGKTSCDVKLTIEENPYEYFNVLCEAEAFMEDVILMGLEMLSMELDLDLYKTSVEGEVTHSSLASTSAGSRNKKSATNDKKKQPPKKKPNRTSMSSTKPSEDTSGESSLIKYILNFGGCELCTLQKRSVIMVNNSEKVYKFTWIDIEYVIIKPSMGYISPGEEKDFEILFYAGRPVHIVKELLTCHLIAITDDSLTTDVKGATWDNRQVVTRFVTNRDWYIKRPAVFYPTAEGRDEGIHERCDINIEEQAILPAEDALGTLTIVVVYSAVTEYTKFSYTLEEEKKLRDTFIYQTRSFDFKVQNTGNVVMKITWSFHIDDEYPARIDKYIQQLEALEQSPGDVPSVGQSMDVYAFPPQEEDKNDPSKVTLFSGSVGRESVDTWFEKDLPFVIEPAKECLKPNESKSFKVTFAPLEAFDYKVRLKSFIDNLDPYDQNICCKITAKSLIPYVHLDIEESDYLTSGKRKTIGVALPPHMTVLEFNVLGWGCYKKSFNVINPTDEAYEFIFEMVQTEKTELIPVHCNMMKGFVEGGTCSEVTFTFSPTAPGVYESQWKFMIPKYNLIMNLLVVGLVREPEVVFVPTILVITNSLVGFTSKNIIILKNNENANLKFKFKGNSLCNESGKTPVIIQPEGGVLKPYSETQVKLNYTPIQDGPQTFKIFCSITFMTKYLSLCVNALSHSVRPKITYYIIGNEHILKSDAITNIHLDETASTYERTVPFKIKNDGSASFYFDWGYSQSKVKKYLEVNIEPKSGYVTPGNTVECILHFLLKQVPVQAFPVNLFISDGPEYSIFLHANIKKPSYHFSCMDFDFGKCIINAPDLTYKKNVAFMNDDTEAVILDLCFKNVPELFVDYHEEPSILPGNRMKVAIYFRPKAVREYEFKLIFYVNTLCEEILTIRGEGVPLLFDLYEGCQKSFNLGPVKVGSKIVRTIEVMNHSKVSIDANFVFRDMYPVIDDNTNSEATSICLSPSAVNQQATAGPSRVKMLQTYKNDKVRDQIAMDIKNALSSLKVVPNKSVIKPYRKIPLKIQFKPVGMISNLDVQLNMVVLGFERPLVKLSGSATGMSFCLNQNSLQFGRVRKRGVKILKVMLLNKGDYGARFWWQPLISDEFSITPLKGHIAPHTNVTFTIQFIPINHNPFIKVWASCNIENYKPLELAMYATCIDVGTIQNRTMYIECPVREVQTQYVVVTNPTDDMWLVFSEISGGPFDTLKDLNVEPNSTFEIPVNFRPKTIGKHESVALYSPLGESALFVALVGCATHPNPNGTIDITMPAKERIVKELLVHNISEDLESYVASTEIVKITPDKFDGFYEIKHTETVKVWGEAAATFRWEFACYEECEMNLKVMFVNEETREYQFYVITVTVTASRIVDTLTFTSKARETTMKEVLINNSLSIDASFDVICNKLQSLDKIKISRNSEARLPVSYSPLVVGVTEDYLEIINTMAGSYMYKAILKCLPAKEKEMEASTPLGTIIPLRIRVQNKSDVKAEFVTTISHGSIQAEKTYILDPLEKGKFLVWFEPQEIGLQNCRLSFDSPDAGEFVFNIKGIGAEPKPQGPYKIKAGGSTTILFKNVFEDARIFKVYVDREEFYVKSLFEQIKSKKDLKIVVNLMEQPAAGWTEMPTGSLTVENYDPALPKVSWTYFLQGIP